MHLPPLARRHWLGTFAAMLLAALPLATPAQPGSLSIVVPQPAGNPTDGVARKLQPLLQKALGQAVIVENVAGAGGSIGTAKVLNAPADGHQLLIASQTEPILTPMAVPQVKYKPEELRMVGLVARTSYILVGRPDLPARTLVELQALAAKPGARPLSYGHIGPGSMIHLLGEQWARQSKVAVTHVPYKGVPPLSQDVMGGQIDLAFLPLGGNLPALIDGGKLRAFGATTATGARGGAVPAMATQGPAMKDFVYGTWVALLVPRKTPEATVQRLHTALAGALKDAELLAYVNSSGMAVSEPLGLAELERFYTQETTTYQALARTVGVDTQ